MLPLFFLNIMLRVFSAPAPKSSQFILKLPFSDPRRAPGKLFVPLHLFFWVIVLSPFWNFGGFRSSRWHGSNRKNEIYNQGMVLELPELNKSWKKGILPGTFWYIVLAPLCNFGGFRSSWWYHPNPLGEIYSLRLVPELPELKKAWKHTTCFKKGSTFLFGRILKSRMGVKWVGSGRGTSILCQDD